MRRKDNNKRKQFWIGVFIAVIMVSSTFGVIFYGFNQDQGKVVYKGVSYVRTQEGWTAKINNKMHVFNFLPVEVGDIKIDTNIQERIKNTLEIDVTYDPASSFSQDIALSQFEMMNALDSNNIYVRGGFTDANELGIPVITCNQSSAYVPVIFFKDSNQTSISEKDSCIIAEIKSGFDALRIKDRILYAFYGIEVDDGK